MTIAQFRQTTPYVTRMRELLSDQVMQMALLALYDSNLPVDPPDDEADALASVRRHSRGVGFNKAVADLLSLADHVAPPVGEEETTYGVESNQSQL